jgi:hypothetical protein
VNLNTTKPNIIAKSNNKILSGPVFGNFLGVFFLGVVAIAADQADLKSTHSLCSVASSLVSPSASIV